MSRPKKDYCEWFSHDRDMRNHRKIKSLRLKFGIQGYGIWVMFLEFLTGSDYNVFHNNEIELELLSGDFGVSASEIKDILDYCIKLNLLIEKNGVIYSENLDERFKSVYNKRNKENVNNHQKYRNCVVSASETMVSASESTQSKVEYSKVNKENNNFKEYTEIKEQNNLESNTTQNVLLEKSNLFAKPNIPTLQQVEEKFVMSGGTREMAKVFFDKNEATGWFYKGSAIKSFSHLVPGFIKTWRENESKKTKVLLQPPITPERESFVPKSIWGKNVVEEGDL